MQLVMLLLIVNRTAFWKYRVVLFYMCNEQNRKLLSGGKESELSSVNIVSITYNFYTYEIFQLTFHIMPQSNSYWPVPQLIIQHLSLLLITEATGSNIVKAVL